MISIVDYGVGNIYSLLSSFKAINEDVILTADENVILNSDRLILPGVGAFEEAIEKLRQTCLDKTIFKFSDTGKPVLGICLGMQLLFDKSYENGEYKGLGLIPGIVTDMKSRINSNLKVPHMGWNALKFSEEIHPIFKYLNDGDHVYFVHSYYATECENSIIANTEYDIDITAAVSKDNVIGCQFHPEKSGKVGLNILKAFCEL